MRRNGILGLTVFLAAGWIASQSVLAEYVTNDDAFGFQRLEEMERQAEAGVTGDSASNMMKNATSGVTDVISDENSTSDGEKLVDSLAGQDRSLGMWRSLGALLIVLGGLFMVSKWVQGRMPNRIGGSGDSRMKILERLTIDHKRQLVLVSAGERELVVAVSPTRIDAISEWPVDTEKKCTDVRNDETNEVEA